MGQYQEYEQYKDSGVKWLGRIPKHWKKSIIGYYFDIQLGKMLQNEPESIKDEEVFYLKALHVQWDKVTISDLPKMWASPTDKEKYGVSNGDLLICEGGEVGRANLLSGIKEDCIIQNALHRVRPFNQSSVDYLNYLMRHIADAKWFDLLCNKATISHLTSEKLRAIAFPVPPLSEQKQIAQFLDYKTAQIDALIAKKEALLEKLSEQRSAIITQAVTKGLDPTVPMKDSGIEWLGEIPKHWKVIRTKFLVTYMGSGKTPRGGSEVYIDNGIILLRSQNIHDEGLRLDEVVHITDEADTLQASSRVKPQDVLLNITGASIGRVSLVPNEFPPANVNQHVCIFRPDIKTVLPKFLHLLMCSKQGKEQIFSQENGTSREGLNFRQAGNLVFALPPLKEQDMLIGEIHKKLQKFNTTAQKITKMIALLKEYRTALITNAVTGKIDVRDIKLPELDQHQSTVINKNGTNR